MKNSRAFSLAPFFLLWGILVFPLERVWGVGYSPSNQWAVVATVPGMGVRYAASPQYGVEGRFLFGEGFAASLRGDSKWDRFGWRIKPLVGVEMSFLSDVGSDRRQGGALGLFLGGEMPVSRNMTVQMDFGPALVRLQGVEGQKTTLEYANIVNFSTKYYFGRDAR